MSDYFNQQKEFGLSFNLDETDQLKENDSKKIMSQTPTNDKNTNENRGILRQLTQKIKRSKETQSRNSNKNKANK